MHNIKTRQDNIKLQKELFIATLIHDLKNPLQAQICSLKLLKEEHFGKISENQKEILDIIFESCNFMQSLLLSVLDTYKLDNGLLKVNPESINMDNIIELCINEIYNFSANNHIKIEYINTTKNPYIYADYKLIRRAFTNLLNNAVNYSFKNTVLTIIYEEDEKNIVVKIKNIGNKVSKAVKEHIFDKYTVGNITSKTGIGFGLYSCKKIIEIHCGTIQLNCDDNTNEFVINLPKNAKIKDVLKFV